MAAGFSVKDALNKNSKAGIDESPRARFRTKDISIFKMYRNDMNFYSVEQIEELAGDILMYGLKQNLELVYAPCEMGEYRIVAGERRWEALKYLVSKGYKEFELATSKLTTPQDDDEEQVEIIIANAYRTKTVSDMIEEETRLKASLERMKAAGKKIKGYDLQSGRLRDVISSMLHVSKTKIAQIEAINNNLIPEWKEELKKERLTFSAAYELSGMTEDEQRETLGKFSETGELTHKEVKDMKEAKAAGQQVSESDTEENGMNPPEARAGDDYETPHPEGITSLCYSCTEYETCNVKTGTCTSCDQYKKATRFIVAKLLNNGEPYTIPTGSRAVINIAKPDGKHVYNTCSYSGSDVTVELTNQALAASGTAYCDIEIRTSDDSQIITSASFTMEIEKSQRDENAILSSNEFTDLENRIKGHIETIENTDAAVKKAESARVTAENARVKAESERTAAEKSRQENENTRIQQEKQRQQDTSQAVKNAEDATAATKQATKDCEEVTDRAEDALQNQEQLEATLNTATQIRQEVSQMQSAVEEAKKQVEQDKKDIDDTIQNSLLASAEKILESVQDYFNRAEALYSSMYLDCDGETPYLRTVTPIFIDGATPQVRRANEGVDFDGGTPTSRQLAV